MVAGLTREEALIRIAWPMVRGGLLATAQVAPVARTYGIAESVLAVSLVLNPIANGSGRMFWGWVSDKLGRERTMEVAFFIQALSLVAVGLVGAKSGVIFVASMAMVFFTWGEVYVLFPSASADFFGAKYASSNYSFLYSTKGVASIIGGGLAATIFEAYGSWGPAFYGSAMLALIAAFMAIRLKGMTLPVKQGVQAASSMSAAD